MLVTGEAVALDLREAALPSRMLAAIIDTAVQGAALLLLTWLFSLTGTSNQATAAATVIVILVAVFLGYPVAMESLWRGKSIGKAAMGLRVVRDDAGPITFRQAFVRGLVGLFLERPGITFYSAGVICSLVNSRGKRLGDLLAGTVVIQERVVGTHGFHAVMPPPLAAWAETLDLSRVPDDLALSVRSFLVRAPQLSEASRAELGNRLASAVAAVTSPAPPPGTPGWAFLTAVLAERRRRAEAAAATAYQPPSATYQPPAAWAPSSAPPPPAPQDPQPKPAAGGFHLPG